MIHDKVIWIIDDDPGILEVVEIIVHDEGYQTMVIDNANSIDEELKKKQPDLILLDILMSGNDGSEIAKKLKSNPASQHIPIIMMSADIHIADKTKDANADGYLQKPFNIEDLVGILKKYA